MTQADDSACSFCTMRASRAVAGRRSGATPRVVCAGCVQKLHASAAQKGCDFCDHPGQGAASGAGGNVTICGDCLVFARQVLGDDDEPGDDEGRLDGELLWSDLTPAPRPDVDPDAPATAHADLALAFFEMGLFDDAREQVGKALALDPRHPVALRIIEKLPPPGASPKGR
ncbi:MAG TPA: tetratricopeptide repeat protein [Polyangiaceae bacterium]|jgi:hypothetical protein